MIIPNDKIERWERHLSHICQPPQLRLDGGTLSSQIGALRSLIHERKCSFNNISTKCNQISEVTYDQMGILRPSHQFIKKIRRENLLNGSRSCIHALCSSILIGVSMQKIILTYNKACVVITHTISEQYKYLIHLWIGSEFHS
jgi:hypothetical protein